jgi:hypothetical protein
MIKIRKHKGNVWLQKEQRAAARRTIKKAAATAKRKGQSLTCQSQYVQPLANRAQPWQGKSARHRIREAFTREDAVENIARIHAKRIPRLANGAILGLSEPAKQARRTSEQFGTANVTGEAGGDQALRK